MSILHRLYQHPALNAGSIARRVLMALLPLVLMLFASPFGVSLFDEDTPQETMTSVVAVHVHGWHQVNPRSPVPGTVADVQSNTDFELLAPEQPAIGFQHVFLKQRLFEQDKGRDPPATT